MSVLDRFYPISALEPWVPDGRFTNRTLTNFGLGPGASKYAVTTHNGYLSLDQADTVACNLGSHIDLLWPEVRWIDEWIEADLERLLAWVHRWLRTNG